MSGPKTYPPGTGELQKYKVLSYHTEGIDHISHEVPTETHKLYSVIPPLRPDPYDRRVLLKKDAIIPVTIEPCMPGQLYSTTLVKAYIQRAFMGVRDGMGNPRYESVYFSAKERAKSIVDAFEAEGIGGLFLAAGDAPTADEVRVARSKFIEFCRAKIQDADSEWVTSGKKPNSIENWAQVAARFTGYKAEWVGNAVSTLDEEKLLNAGLNDLPSAAQRAGTAPIPSTPPGVIITKNAPVQAARA